jgi:hypothetical protein
MKTCDKCDSEDIVLVPGEKAKWGRTVSTSLTGSVPLDRYVCMDCGYTETFVSNRVSRESIRKKFG